MRQHHAVDGLVVVEKHVDVHLLGRGRRGVCGVGRRRAATLRLHDDARGDAAVDHHQRPMAGLVEKQFRGEAARSGHVEDVGLAIRRFGFARVLELERHRRRSGKQQTERQPRELRPRVAQPLRFGLAAARRRRRHADDRARRRVQRLRVPQQLLAVDALFGHDERGVAHRADAVAAQQLVGQLQIDGDVAGHLPIANRALHGTGARQALHFRDLAFSAERRARLREQFGRLRITGGARRVAAECHRQRKQNGQEPFHRSSPLEGV
jgi:hypothetical protein